MAGKRDIQIFIGHGKDIIPYAVSFVSEKKYALFHRADFLIGPSILQGRTIKGRPECSFISFKKEMSTPSYMGRRRIDPMELRTTFPHICRYILL